MRNWNTLSVGMRNAQISSSVPQLPSFYTIDWSSVLREHMGVITRSSWTPWWSSVTIQHAFIRKRSSYIKHLMDHTDSIGTAMLRRFNAITEDCFLTVAQLDLIAPSPHSLNNISSITKEPGNTHLMVTINTIHLVLTDSFSTIAILCDRLLQVNYTCHWKNRLIKSKIIETNSLLSRDWCLCVYVIAFS